MIEFISPLREVFNHWLQLQVCDQPKGRIIITNGTVYISVQRA